MGYISRHVVRAPLTSEIHSLYSNFLVLSLIRRTVLLFSRAFFVLYLITIVDFATLGYLFAFSFVLEAITDYPTGVLSDKWGHRNVLFIAYLMYGFSFLYLSFSKTFTDLVIVFSLQALANGQESGALQSWFDNNYFNISKDYDPDRSIYSGFIQKFLPFNDLVGLTIGVVGGYIASTFTDGRVLAFRIQGIMMITFGFILLTQVRNYYAKKEKKQKGYIFMLLEGLGFVLFNPRIFIMSLGLIFDVVTKSIWLSLLMLPIYYGYTGSDFLISILNLAIFGFTLTYIIMYSDQIQKLRSRFWYPIIVLLQAFTFFGTLYILGVYIPPTNSVNYIGIIILVLSGGISGILLIYAKTLNFKVMLDAIPNEKRNGYYSLIPTISLLIAAALNIYVGHYIHTYGLNIAFLGLTGMKIIASGFIFLAILVGLGKRSRIRLFDNEHMPFIFDSNLGAISNSFRDFRPSDWYLSETTKKIWVSLLDVANKDNTVSDEEIDLLVKSMERTNSYLRILERCYDDGEITTEEAKLLEAERTKILEAANTQALADRVVSKDETNILKKLEEILEELEKIEKIGMKIETSTKRKGHN